jgi:hypothetical protein
MHTHKAASTPLEIQLTLLQLMEPPTSDVVSTLLEILGGNIRPVGTSRNEDRGFNPS